MNFCPRFSKNTVVDTQFPGENAARIVAELRLGEMFVLSVLRRGNRTARGFPDPAVMEVFLKSSNIISTAHSRTTRTLYIKFTGNVVYRYFGVTEALFEEFLNARSHGKFAHRDIYSRFRQERC